MFVGIVVAICICEWKTGKRVAKFIKNSFCSEMTWTNYIGDSVP